MKIIALLLGICLLSVSKACENEGNVFLPYPYDCSKYYSVVNGENHTLSCPEGMHFTEKGCKCEWKELVDDCKVVECDPDRVYLIKSEESCSEYLLCFHGYALKQECVDGFEFSEEEGTCIPDYESNCFINTCPQDDDNSELIFIPYKYCDMYLVCVSGIPIKQFCAKGLHWSVKAKRCEPEAIAGCKSKFINVQEAMQIPSKYQSKSQQH